MSPFAQRSTAGGDKYLQILDGKLNEFCTFLNIKLELQSQPLVSQLNMSYNSLEEEGGVDLILALITNRYVTSLVGN